MSVTNELYFWQNAGSGPLWGRSCAALIDRLSIENHHILGLNLMERAGTVVAQHVLSCRQNNEPILILVGTGNNGGDGLVCARKLHEQGINPIIVQIGAEQSKMTNDCALQLATVRAEGMSVIPYEPGVLTAMQLTQPLIIDGVAGIGLKGMLREGPLRSALAEAKTLEPRFVIAIDIPSGMDVDLLQPDEAPLLRANLTVTFGGAKPAHIISPARQYCGKLAVHEIGFHPAAITEALNQQPYRFHLIDPPTVLGIDPYATLGQEGSKYDRGHVLIIGGSRGKTGAPLMSALAALRAGCGWVSCALSPSAMSTLNHAPLELTFEDLFIDETTLDATRLVAFCRGRKVRAIVIGCGMVTNPLNSTIMQALTVLSHTDRIFVVLDAGALAGVGRLLVETPLAPERTVITPHPGEWNKALSQQHAAIKDFSSLDRAASLIRTWGVTLMYKTATPLVLSPHHPQDVLCTNYGSNTLSKAGTGDILAGVIAAHGAVGVHASLAAIRSQIWLADISNKLTRHRNPHGLMATDLIDGLGDV